MSELELHRLLLLAFHRSNRAIVTQTCRFPLLPGQPKILDFLKDHDGSGQKDIAQGCHIEPGTLTTLLNRMEETGLVERRTMHGNRRNYYVFMTEKGKIQAGHVTKAFEELEKDAFRGISAENQKLFMELFSQICENTSCSHSEDKLSKGMN